MKNVIKLMVIRMLQAYAAVIVAIVIFYFAIGQYREFVFDIKIILTFPITCFLIALPINYYEHKKHNKI